MSEVANGNVGGRGRLQAETSAPERRLPRIVEAGRQMETKVASLKSERLLADGEIGEVSSRE